MAAHRYWRAVGLEACGAGDLELSAFHLLAAGIRVDAPATLTSNAAPDVSGALEDLQDDVLTTAPRWSAQAVKTLILQWDFGGSPADVGAIQLAGDSEVLFLLIVKIMWSDDGVAWAPISTLSGIQWLGSGQAVDVPVADVIQATSVMLFDGTNEDLALRNWSGPFGTFEAGVYGLARKFGNRYESLASAQIVMGAADWTIEMKVKLTIVAGKYAWLLTQDANTEAGTRGFQFLYGAAEGCLLFTASPGVSTTITGPALDAQNYSGGYLFVVCQRRGDVLTIAVDGVAKSTALPAGYVMPALGSTPLTIGPISEITVIDAPFSMDRLRITLGAARYVTDFSEPAKWSSFGDGQNRVKGRVAPADTFALVTGPAILYGAPSIAPPVYLGVESGCVKDYITGVLGQGVGRVRGTIKEKGTVNTPLHRKVRLIREKDGLVIREAWSDPVTGAYDFKYVDEAQTFTVISYDHLHNHRAVVADNMIPEAMP